MSVSKAILDREDLGMPSSASIPLAEADPELTRHLKPADLELLARVRLPLRLCVPGEVDLGELRDGGAFTALVLEGMLLQSRRLGDQAGLHVLGPGDLLTLVDTPSWRLIHTAGTRATVPTRIALLGNEFLVALRRWPSLAVALQERATEQSERLVAQLTICQLPRVEDRLLSMLWLLAETWGRVTNSGTLVPLQLTHSTLGMMIGARRSTVTLAFGQLLEENALARLRDGWLLLRSPTAPSADPISVAELTPMVLEPVWRPSAEPERTPMDRGVGPELSRTVARLRAEHLDQSRLMRQRLAELVASRERVAGVRMRINRERQLRQPAPSSRSPR